MAAAADELVLSKFYLYSTAARYYLVGRSKDGHWIVLTLVRAPGAKAAAAAAAAAQQQNEKSQPQLEAHETASPLTQAECGSLLRQIHAGNAATGGLQLVCKAYGVIGCIQFLESHYLLLITKRAYQGALCGHKVYSISDTALVPLVQPSAQGQESMAEKRYRKLLLGMDLTHDFFFSYTYSLAATLQQNMTAAAQERHFDSMFVWNAYLTRPLRDVLGNDRWVVPLIHGFWQQRTLSVLAQTLTMTLVARRSRHFAGTRYQKRGVNHEGRVANDVETEQIVVAGLDRRHASTSLSSIVQVRGSIPLYWSQQGSRLSKPDILLQTFDPLYSATRTHFEDLHDRYGAPLVCLNLVKALEKRPREVVLRSEFDTAISYINQTLPVEQQVTHLPFDLNYHAKQQGAALLESIVPVLDTCLDATGLFVHTVGAQPQAAQRQEGVLRTNCIDCLDRTNVAQFAAGLAALGRQLAALGIADGSVIDARSSLARQLMDLYEAMGNTLARQYGGSEAHSTFFQRQRGDWEAATQSRDMLTSIRRIYNNAYTDAEKQAAINLFLGNFTPRAGKPALWDLDSDYYLHFGTTLKRASSTGGSLSRPGSCELPQVVNASSGGGGGGGSSSLWRLPGLSRQPASAVQALGTPATPLRQRGGPDASAPVLRVQRMLQQEAAASESVRTLAAVHEWAEAQQRSTAANAAPSAQQLVSHAVDVASGNSSPVRSSGCTSLDAPRSGNPAGSPLSASPQRSSSGSLMATAAAAAPGGSSLLKPRRRAKLESLDKLIGQQPVHHVRLHVPASHASYLPQWLAAPLGRARTAATGPPAPAPAPAPALAATSTDTPTPIAEHTSGAVRCSVDIARRPPAAGVRRTQSTDSGLRLLVPQAPHEARKPVHASPPGPSVHHGDSFWDMADDSPFFGSGRAEALPDPTPALPQEPPLPPHQESLQRGPVTPPELALTGDVSATQKIRVTFAAPTIGAMLASGPNGLGISPFLLAWWLASEEHLAAWFAAEKALKKHYTRFIADAHTLREPSEVRSCYRQLCKMPAIPTLVNDASTPVA